MGTLALLAVAAGLLAQADAPDGFLDTRGTDIVTAAGEPIQLRGINLGGWLMMETWIPALALGWEEHLRDIAQQSDVGIETFNSAIDEVGPFDDDTMRFGDYLFRLVDHIALHTPQKKLALFQEMLQAMPPVVDASTLDSIWRTRFGPEGADALWEAFHANWITEEDFRRIAELGFNFVRIPIWYRWFEDDATPFVYHDRGMKHLENAVAWAAAHGLRVLIDLHGAAGGQNPWEHTGTLSRGELFTCATCLERTAALWTHLATRFRDNTTILGYGLLNEPFSAKDTSDWIRVHDVLYKAIRKVDTRHLIQMEDGYKLEDAPWKEEGFFPNPGELGWERVFYAVHFYHGKEQDAETLCATVEGIVAREQARTGVPFYLGEFNSLLKDPAAATAAMQHFLARFNARGWSWSPWTWKYTGQADNTLWGVIQYTGEWKVPSNSIESKDALLERIRLLHSNNFTLVEPYAGALRAALTVTTP